MMEIPKKKLSADLVVTGGGIAGICTAVAAARNGASVILLQDRPVLGGNASSEIRMWICGARGAENREAGLLEELMLLNLQLNPTLTYTLWDHVMYTFVTREKNIRLLLNTTVTGCRTEGARIVSVTGWDLHSYTEYEVEGTFFADCSGDSILRLSGAEYRTGREGAGEFGESFAPERPDRRTMGSSIMIQLRRAQTHVPFRAPDWAYHFTDATFRRRKDIFAELRDENFWWMEFGGVMDTIADADKIRHELLKIAFGSWEYIKNNKISDAEHWELDWIGALPGKRESARYAGDHTVSQKEIEAGGIYPDAVAHGGWTMDDHNPEAFFSAAPPTIFHPAPSPFGLPYRALYSRNVENLFFAGRNISVTHMALSATRVMGTCATLGQAAGTAAALAVRYGLSPRGIYEQKIAELQKLLLDQDQFIPGLRRTPSIFAQQAEYSHEILRSGIDRDRDGKDNGAWLKPGESCFCRFSSPVRLSSCRMTFDSDFSQDKKMRNQNSLQGEPRKMPGTLVKRYSLAVLAGGAWREVFREEENARRCVRADFPAVDAGALRLTICETWGGPDAPAHIFAFEPVEGE